MSCNFVLTAWLLLMSPGEAPPEFGVCPSGVISSSCEDKLLDDCVDGCLDHISLFEGAMIAGGDQSKRNDSALKQKFEIWLESQAVRSSSHSSEHLARSVLENLHEDLLIGKYDARCSNLETTLRTGNYNCVSATVLYILAMRRLGIKAEAYAAPGHVYCRIGEQGFDVETTCSRWFRISAQQAARARERVSSVRQQTNQSVRRLDDIELIAKLYYNRGVAHFRKNSFAEGLRLTRCSLKLDPQDQIAQGNLLAGMNNWALQLCRRKKFAQAAELLDEIKKLDPKYPTLTENEHYLYRLWSAQQLSDLQTPATDLWNVPHAEAPSAQRGL